LGAGRVRAAAEGVAGVRPAVEGRRRGSRRDVRPRMTLTHVERPARGEPEGLLVLLHGRGADEHDLFPLLDALDPDRRLLGVTPRAPLSLPPGGAHWYALHRLGYPERETFLSTYPPLAAWLDGLAEETGVGLDRAI